MVGPGLDIATDLLHIRMEQARLLKARAAGSAIAVELIVLIYTALITSAVSLVKGLIWFALATFMVIVTVIYARFKASRGITKETVKNYLWGHIVICACTGLVWGGYAIHILDFESNTLPIIAGTMPLLITIGGVLPSSAYRPGYIALASFALIPYGFYLLLSAPDIFRYFGLGTLIYFGFAMISSAQAEINTRDGIIARAGQMFTQNLMNKNKEIERVNEEKLRFLTSTSHDFSQPLHAQGYFLQSLRGLLTTTQQKEVLDKIWISWNAQKDLLQGLSESIRLDSGGVMAKPVLFDLRSELKKLLTQFEASATQKNVELIASLENVSVFSDPALLNRIVQNLLDNAIRFAPDHSQVQLKTIRRDEMVVVSVIDKGPGIDPSKQDKVFDPYVQIETSSFTGKATGMGLGLSIVNRLSDLLDIELEIVSYQGEGTEFRLHIPLGIPGPDIGKQMSGDVQKISGNPLVMLVDDNEDVRKSMSIALTELGVQIISAATSRDAVNLLTARSDIPILLIIDKRLRHGDMGIALIDLLREEVNEDIPAILMTGDVTGFDAVANIPNIQIMIKPISPSEMIMAIQQMISPAGKAANGRSE